MRQAGNVFQIKQNDSLPALKINVRARDEFGSKIPFNLSGVTACTFSMIDDCGNLKISSSQAQITCFSGGCVQYNWINGDTTDFGRFKAEFQLYFSDGNIMSIPTVGEIGVEIVKNFL